MENSKTDLDLELPSLPPKLPPSRTFQIRTKPPKDGLESPAHVVECHQVEISSNGDLLMFEYTFTVTPSGYQPSTLLRRAFAKGEWKDLEEVMIVKPGSGILFN